MLPWATGHRIFHRIPKALQGDIILKAAPDEGQKRPACFMSTVQARHCRSVSKASCLDAERPTSGFGLKTNALCIYFQVTLLLLRVSLLGF